MRLRGTGAGQHHQGDWFGARRFHPGPIVGQQGEVAIQGPAVVASLLGAPVAQQGLLERLPAKLLPAELLRQGGPQAGIGQAAKAHQLRRRPTGIGGQDAPKLLHRHLLKAQPAALEQQHRQVPMPTKPLLGLQQGIGALALALAEQGPPVLAGLRGRGPEAVERHGDGVVHSPPYGQFPDKSVSEVAWALMTELVEARALRLGWLLRLS